MIKLIQIAGQYGRILDFLKELSKKNEKKFRIFPSYDTLHRAEKENMPSNCYYELTNLSTGKREIHQPIISSGPTDIMKQFKEMSLTNMPAPNMVAKAFPITDVIAKELEAMSPEIKDKLLQNDLDVGTVMEVILKTCEDGTNYISKCP